MSAPLLACRGVDIGYGARALVRGLDLEIRRGERWAIAGPNGAGKSTLLLVIAGARRPEHGSVTLQERPVQDWSVAQLAALRSMVADRWVDPFAMEVVASVTAARYRLHHGLPEGRRTARKDEGAQDEAVALRCLDAMDAGPLARRDIRTLSRGERQRVALAAALAQEAALVLLDEPISHQDPRHQALVLDTLRQRAQGTFVAALHDINAAARFATHALLLFGDGRWRAGSAGEMFTCERLSELFCTRIVQVEVDTHRVFVSTGETNG